MARMMEQIVKEEELKTCLDFNIVLYVVDSFNRAVAGESIDSEKAREIRCNAISTLLRDTIYMHSASKKNEPDTNLDILYKNGKISVDISWPLNHIEDPGRLEEFKKGVAEFRKDIKAYFTRLK